MKCSDGMTEQRVVRRGSRRRLVGLQVARRFSQSAWWRFSRERRQQYVQRISGTPSIEQVNRIDALVSLEWMALRNEREALDLAGKEGREAMRDARNARAVLLKALNDFERELRRPQPKPPSKTLDQVLDEIAAKAAAERAAAIDDTSASRSSLTIRSCSVPNARSMRPFAWGLLAQIMSMFSVNSARPNWVTPSPPAASLLFTRKMPCLSL